jgi:hypothetical protein
MKPDVSFLVSGAFAGLAVAVALAFLAGLRWTDGDGPPARRRLGVATALTALWMGLTWGLAVGGVLSRFDVRPPPLLLLLVGSGALGLGLGLSPAGGRLARGLPLAALVGAQAFRLPLELAMHQAAREGALPARMTFAGTNFDVLTGASALLLALLLARGRAGLAWVAAWNACGVVLLGNVLVTAVRATPLVHAFGTDPAELNTLVAFAPFVWLPSVLVVAALCGHVVVARRVLHDARAHRAVAA